MLSKMTRPTYLFGVRNKTWARIQGGIGVYSQIILFLDYDGTIVPIQRTPSLAVISPTMKNLLRRLARHPGISVGLVTGRAMSDARKLVPQNFTFYIANHGFEIFLNGKHWVHPKIAQLRQLITTVHHALKHNLTAIPSVLVENKRFTLTVHYRNVSKKMIPSVQRIVLKTIHPHHSMLKVTKGKKVLEVRPNILWGKGYASFRVLNILRAMRGDLIIYLGDDITDENAFKLLRSFAVTIHVGGKRSSHAKYYVRNPGEVQKFLRNLNQ